MARDVDLLGSYSGRKESPEIELIMQEEISKALEEALGKLGLYQKKRVTLDRIDQHLRELYEKHDLDRYKLEFSCRPWVPVTPKLPQDKYMRARFFCGIGDNPLGTPQSEMSLPFPLPSITTHCPNCDDSRAFLSVGSIWYDGFLDYYPKLGEQTEQVFTLYYQCIKCEECVITFLIKRVGLTINICGRTERLPVDVPSCVPKKLRKIVADAISATNENDIFAGFYHLRTFCEHYIKTSINAAQAEKVSGDELCRRYNSVLDNRMTSGIPSLVTVYETLSRYMHMRSGTADDFAAMLDQVEGHLTAKALFEKYS